MDDGFIVPTRHKIDVDMLYRMMDAGILHECQRVELIDGEIMDMAPIGFDHAATMNVLNETLVLACHGRAVVSGQNPVRVDTLNEPQPDFVVFRPRADNYRTAPRGGAEDALLVIEVSDSTIRFDRGVKLPLYARAGFAEFWIVDLKRRVVTVYTDPSDGEYATVRTYRDGETIVLSEARELAIPLSGIFG